MRKIWSWVTAPFYIVVGLYALCCTRHGGDQRRSGWPGKADIGGACLVSSRRSTNTSVTSSISLRKSGAC